MKVVVQTWLVGTIVGRDGHKIRWASIQLHCRVLIVMLLRASTPARHTCICHRGLLLEHLAGSSVKAVRLSFPMLPCAGRCRSAQAAACRSCRCRQRSRAAPGVTGSRCVCLLLQPASTRARCRSADTCHISCVASCQQSLTVSWLAHR